MLSLTPREILRSSLTPREILRSMHVDPLSKTPYSDATQVGQISFIYPGIVIIIQQFYSKSWMVGNWFFSLDILQGVPRYMTVSRRRLCIWIYSVVTYFNMYDFKQLPHNSPIFQNGVCLFCAFNITGDIKNFVQLSILLNKSKIVEIWTKFFISRVINWKHKKGRSHFGNARTRGILWLLSLEFYLQQII